jgi:alpha-beta hydrolase superfamily lysophospholipase
VQTGGCAVVFKYLATEAGIATLSFDVEGHGASDPQPPAPRHAIKRFSHIVHDALLHIKSVLVPFCETNCNGAPVFLMGSSMGALAVWLPTPPCTKVVCRNTTSHQ